MTMSDGPTHRDTGTFKPNLSRLEARNEVTNRVAREIIDGEAAARMAKTERLRAARIAQEADATKKARRSGQKEIKRASKPLRRA